MNISQAVVDSPPEDGKITKERLFTIADVAALPAELPSGPVLYELNNGRLIPMPPAADLHGSVENKFAGAFLYQGEKKGHGKSRCGEVGIILWRNPDRLVGADAAFITNKSLPLKISREGYLETIPELIGEVKSKNDTTAEIEAKVQDYLRAGVQLVWVADPKTKTVTAYRPGQEPRVYTIEDILTAEDIIPRFQLPVREVFAE